GFRIDNSSGMNGHSVAPNRVAMRINDADTQSGSTTDHDPKRTGKTVSVSLSGNPALQWRVPFRKGLDQTGRQQRTVISMRADSELLPRLRVTSSRSQI